MLHCAWIKSCYEPVGYGAAFSQQHMNAEIWLGHTTTTTQKKPVPKAAPVASDIQDDAGTLLAQTPCMSLIELPGTADVRANFTEYNHSLLQKLKRCEDMQTEDGDA
jgi:hypothetical protein